MSKHGERDRSRRGAAERTTPRGFTLVELMVVVVIIGIIISFVMLAASDAAHRAEERATQSLITKLEQGLNERIDALSQSRPDINWAHAYMAATWNSNVMIPAGTRAKSTDRAQVFAWYDYLKREIPDVFILQNDPLYPINFAFPYPNGYPGTPNPTMSPNTNYANFMLPLGNTILNNAGAGSYGDTNPAFPFVPQTNPNLGLTGAGIMGASYANAAGLFKNIPGNSTAGWDAVDNNGNNLIDDINEGGWNVPSPQLSGLSGLQVLQTNHKHVTARAEMLYAILVEGIGPWGSVFSRDDFTDREVQDTDGDGLPEFVDAWGQPLQFFRWPLFYHSDLQRGQIILTDPNQLNTWDLLPPYQSFDTANAGQNAMGSVFQERERDPLDPNQQLTAPQWWSQFGVQGQLAANNQSPFSGIWQPAQGLNVSGGGQVFEYFFHRLTEPIPPGFGARLLGPWQHLRTPVLLHQVSDPFGWSRQAAGRVPLCGCGPRGAGPERGGVRDRE